MITRKYDRDKRDLGLVEILVHHSKDGKELFLKEDAAQIIDLLVKQLDFPISDEDYQNLLEKIPLDKELEIFKLFEILRDLPISIWADYASHEIYK